MASEWRQATFGDFLALQRGHDLPDQDRVPGNVPILGSFGITGWHNSAKAKAPGMTIGRSGGSFGVATYTDCDYFPLNTTLYVTDFKGNHPKFAYYFAKDFDFTPFNSGSAQPSLNRNFLYPVEVNIPPVEEQKAIAHVLGTLDEKIELNRKTNETLEGIAKSLFKSWFVDFDPVRAKVEGRSTGLPDETSEVFPDSFEDSELGEIPRGWTISTLDEASSYLSRGISPKYCEEVEAVVVLNQKCIRDGAVDFSKSRRHDSNSKSIEGRKIAKFDCLVNSTGVGTLGRVAITPELNQKEVIVDSHVTVIRGMTESHSFYLSNLLLGRQRDIEALGEGSTGQTELSRAVLGRLRFVMPAEPLINLFYSSALSLYEKKWANELLSSTLASIRDALLPRLISGELRVPDAEKMLEEIGI